MYIYICINGKKHVPIFTVCCDMLRFLLVSWAVGKAQCFTCCFTQHWEVTSFGKTSGHRSNNLPSFSGQSQGKHWLCTVVTSNHDMHFIGGYNTPSPPHLVETPLGLPTKIGIAPLWLVAGVGWGTYPSDEENWLVSTNLKGSHQSFKA